MTAGSTAPNDWNAMAESAKSSLRKKAEQRSKASAEVKREKEAVARASAEDSNKHPDGFLAHLNLKPIWFAAAFIALFAILLIPTGEGLTLAGKQALAILAFAIIMWVTEAVSYTVSSILIVGIITIALSFAPPLTGETPDAMGTSESIKLALNGFSSSAVALVAAALALAAAMQATGLHKRLALIVLKFAGAKTSNVVIGAIAISTILAFFVPSATARAGAVVPILLGMVAASAPSSSSPPLKRSPCGTLVSRPQPHRTSSPPTSSKRPCINRCPGASGSCGPPHGRS